MYRSNIEDIQFENVSMEFQAGEPILSDVSVNIPMNSIVWIRGGSGSGKSVVAKLLAGLVMPTGGAIRVNGNCIGDMTFEEFLPFRRNIGFGFDFGGLINNRDILSNLLLPIEYHQFNFGTPDDLVVRMQEHLKIFELEKVAYQRPSAILGRMRKAACVARAVFHDPEVVILDDPSTGLNPQVKCNLAKLLNRKFDEKIFRHIFITSEDADFMSQFASVTLEVKSSQLNLLTEKVSA